MEFNIDVCPECKAERYLYNITGKVKVEKNTLFLHNGNHAINFIDWLKSWGIREGDKIRIMTERKKEDGRN